MKVKIFSEMSGEIEFDMSESSFMQIIGAATMYAKTHVESKISALKAVEEYAEKQKTEACTPEFSKKTEPPKPVSKVERMFGDVSRRIPVEAVTNPLEKKKEEYKGFLLIECEDCGKLRGYHAKYPTTDYYCDCGHATALHDLRPLHLHCKCGSSFKYMTNIQKSKLTYRCLDCGAPVDMELNNKGNAFVTVGDKRF